MVGVEAEADDEIAASTSLLETKPFQISKTMQTSQLQSGLI